MSSCYSCYLILYYLKLIEVCGGNDWGPSGASVFYDGSGDGFVCVNKCFFIFAP